MTGLTTIENGPYVSPISLILTEVDGTYQEPHWQLCHRSRIESQIQLADYQSFQSNSIIDHLAMGMTSGSFQTQPRLLYVESYLKVGQIITMKSKWFLYSFSSKFRAKCVFSTPVGAMNNAVCGSFLNIFILIYSRNICARLDVQLSIHD